MTKLCVKDIGVSGYQGLCIRRSGHQARKLDPFGGAKPRLLRWGKEAPLRVNPEQAQVFRPGSRRVDFIPYGFLMS
jgi:hypothetical protein